MSDRTRPSEPSDPPATVENADTDDAWGSGGPPAGGRGGAGRQVGPGWIVGTSSEFLGRRPLPRVLRDRPLVLVMGPPGVGKSSVARRLMGDDAVRVTDDALRRAVTEHVRRDAWPDVLLGPAPLIIDGPAFLHLRPGFVRRLRALLVHRARAGYRTAIIEAKEGTTMSELMEGIDTALRASVLLRFPVGRGRRRFAVRVCEEMGIDPRLARRVAGLDPWTYDRVREALAELARTEG